MMGTESDSNKGTLSLERLVARCDRRDDMEEGENQARRDALAFIERLEQRQHVEVFRLLLMMRLLELEAFTYSDSQVAAASRLLPAVFSGRESLSDAQVDAFWLQTIGGPVPPADYLRDFLAVLGDDILDRLAQCAHVLRNRQRRLGTERFEPFFRFDQETSRDASAPCRPHQS